MKKRTLLFWLAVFLATERQVSAAIPNDPLFLNLNRESVAHCCDLVSYRSGLSQWSLYNLGGDTTPLYEASPIGKMTLVEIYHEPYLFRADIRALEAWNIRTDGSSIIVAIIDSGVRADHPDLAPNLWVNEIEASGVPDFDDDGNGVIDDIHGIAVSKGGTVVSGDLTDETGHGTSNAGIIGAAGNNGIGMSGVCWKARMMILKTANRTDPEIIMCMKYAVSHGARIINFSLGSRRQNTFENSPALKEAFALLRDQGIICVLSAGNMQSGTDERDIDREPRFPACWEFDNFIVVTSTTVDDEWYPYALYGKKTVHLAAPGRLILTTGIRDDDPYIYEPGGTSFATPYVTGAAALLWSEHPDWTYRQVIDCLLRTVDKLPSLEGKCSSGGRLNLFRALAEGAEVTAPTLSLLRAEDGVGEVSATLSPYDEKSYILEVSLDWRRWRSVGRLMPINGLTISHRVEEGESAQFFRLTQAP